MTVVRRLLVRSPRARPPAPRRRGLGRRAARLPRLGDRSQNRRAARAARDATRAARAGLGSPLAIRDRVHDVGWETSLEQLWTDVREAARGLRWSPGFTIGVVITLALGIGVNVAMFTLLDTVLLRPLALPAPHELVALHERGREGEPDTVGGTGRFLRFSYPRYQLLQQALGANGALAASSATFDVGARPQGATDDRRLDAQLVSGNYFATLGVSPLRGRLLDAAGRRAERPGVRRHQRPLLAERVRGVGRRRRAAVGRERRRRRDHRWRHARRIRRRLGRSAGRPLDAGHAAICGRLSQRIQCLHRRGSRAIVARSGDLVAPRDRARACRRAPARGSIAAGSQPSGSRAAGLGDGCVGRRASTDRQHARSSSLSHAGSQDCGHSTRR